MNTLGLGSGRDYMGRNAAGCGHAGPLEHRSRADHAGPPHRGVDVLAHHQPLRRKPGRNRTGGADMRREEVKERHVVIDWSDVKQKVLEVVAEGKPWKGGTDFGRTAPHQQSQQEWCKAAIALRPDKCKHQCQVPKGTGEHCTHLYRKQQARVERRPQAVRQRVDRALRVLRLGEGEPLDRRKSRRRRWTICATAIRAGVPALGGLRADGAEEAPDVER